MSFRLYGWDAALLVIAGLAVEPTQTPGSACVVVFTEDR